MTRAAIALGLAAALLTGAAGAHPHHGHRHHHPAPEVEPLTAAEVERLVAVVLELELLQQELHQRRAGARSPEAAAAVSAGAQEALEQVLARHELSVEQYRGLHHTLQHDNDSRRSFREAMEQLRAR